MTATAQNFIRLFQTLAPTEQKNVSNWIDNHRSDIDNGIIDAAFAPMTDNELNEFWQKLSVQNLFSDWTENENDVWQNYISEINNEMQTTK
jgi:hypothetical protein